MIIMCKNSWEFYGWQQDWDGENLFAHHVCFCCSSSKQNRAMNFPNTSFSTVLEEYQWRRKSWELNGGAWLQMTVLSLVITRIIIIIVTCGTFWSWKEVLTNYCAKIISKNEPSVHSSEIREMAQKCNCSKYWISKLMANCKQRCIQHNFASS